MIRKIYTDGGSIDYNYDPAGVLTGITNSRNIEKHYSYDERHNILAVEYSDDTPGGYMFIASYDAENRLISIEYTDTGSVDHKTEYIYAGDGFLAEIKKYENAELVDDVRIVSAGQLPLQERDGYNNIIREYIWGLNTGGGIGGLLGLSQAGNNYSYLYDGKGNVTIVLDEADNIAASYQYSPFGMLISKTGPLDQPFMFSTKRYDDSTGLNYYGYRFYNPSLGKWMTRDPIGETGGINLYGFVGNNPVNFVDPWGLAGIALDAGGGYGTGWGKDQPGSQSGTAATGFYIGATGPENYGEIGGYVSQSRGKLAGARVGLGYTATIYTTNANKFFEGTMNYKSMTILFMTYTKYSDPSSCETTGWSLSIFGKGIGFTGIKEGTVESWRAVLQ